MVALKFTNERRSQGPSQPDKLRRSLASFSSVTSSSALIMRQRLHDLRRNPCNMQKKLRSETPGFRLQAVNQSTHKQSIRFQRRDGELLAVYENLMIGGCPQIKCVSMKSSSLHSSFGGLESRRSLSRMRIPQFNSLRAITKQFSRVSTSKPNIQHSTVNVPYSTFYLPLSDTQTKSIFTKNYLQRSVAEQLSA